MDPLRSKKKKRPEDDIRDSIAKNLRGYGWHVMITHGNLFQQGFPDLYAVHPQHGARWIEVKNPNGYSFTRAQRDNFHRMTHGPATGIWILFSSSEQELLKLFQPQNWEPIMLEYLMRR